MKKMCLILLWGVVATAFCQPVISVPAAVSASGRPSFTNASTYDPYSFASSATGLLARETSGVKLELGYRSHEHHVQGKVDSLRFSSSAGLVPRLTFSAWPTVLFMLEYTPAGFNRSDSLVLPLQRLGLALCAGDPFRLFQIGVKGHGFYGVEEQKIGNDRRLIMGVEDLQLSVGSQLHEYVRLGLFVGANGVFDSLKDQTGGVDFDRSFYGTLPMYGGDLDFGTGTFPVRSNFKFAMGINRFIYTYKYAWANSVDADPIIGDTMAWHWQTQADIVVDRFLIQPALDFGYWQNHAQRYLAVASGSDPLKYLELGAKQTGRNWDVSSFIWGIGSAATHLYGSGWFEYSHASLDLVYGDYWSILNDKKTGYDRIAFGLMGNLHAVSALRFPSSIELNLYAAYENRQENSSFEAFGQSEYQRISPMGAGGRNSYEIPDFGRGSDQRVIITTFGATAAFFNKMLGLDTYCSFFSQNSAVSFDGVEWGVDLRYELKNN